MDEARSVLSKEANNKIEPPKDEVHIVQDLQRQLQEKDAVIEHLFHQIEQMKVSFHSLIDRTDTNVKNNASANAATLLRGATCVGQVPILQDDQAYFSTYSHYDVHHDMLSVSFLFGFLVLIDEFNIISISFRIKFEPTASGTQS